MRVNLKKLALGAASATALIMMASVPASAGIVMTWNPSNITTPLATQPAFSFDQIGVQDYSSIYLHSLGGGAFSATETGYLNLTTATIGTSPSVTVPTPGLNDGTTGAAGYQLYVAFTATATIQCFTATVCSGTFGSLNLSFYGDAGANTTFSFNGTSGAAQLGNNGTDVLLATGSLTSGQNDASVVGGAPSAHATTTFVYQPGEGAPNGFFINPPTSINLDMLGAFTNNTGPSGEVTCYTDGSFDCGSAINGGALPGSAPAGTNALLQIGNPAPGGGTLQFQLRAPEPISISLFGAGLAGAGFYRRKRNKKA